MEGLVEALRHVRELQLVDVDTLDVKPDEPEVSSELAELTAKLKEGVVVEPVPRGDRAALEECRHQFSTLVVDGLDARDIASTVSKLIGDCSSEHLPINPVCEQLVSLHSALHCVTSDTALTTTKLEDITRREECLTAEEDISLGRARTRQDRQSTKVLMFDKRETFWTECLAELMECVTRDEEYLKTIHSVSDDSFGEAVCGLQTRRESTRQTRDHVATMSFVYRTDNEATKTRLSRLEQQLGRSRASLHEALQACLTHAKKCNSLTAEIGTQRKTLANREEVEQRLEALRLCTLDELEGIAVELENQRIAAVDFSGRIQESLASVQELCQEHQAKVQERRDAAAKMYSRLYSEYWLQLRDLREAKSNCLHAVKREIGQCQKEQQRWEKLEHETAAMLQLEDLDKKIASLTETGQSLQTELDELTQKQKLFEDRGTSLLSTVPQFVHPRETTLQSTAASLMKRRQQLQMLLQHWTPTGDPADESGGSSESELDLSEPVRRVQSLKALKSQLRLVDEALESNPYRPLHPLMDSLESSPQTSPAKQGAAFQVLHVYEGQRPEDVTSVVTSAVPSQAAIKRARRSAFTRRVRRRIV